jgi:acyl-CoA synthetase
MKLHPQTRVDEYTANGWWTSETVDGLFRDRVVERGHAVAVIDPPNKRDLMTAPPLRCTWTELDALVDEFAAALAERGVGPGDVVGVQLPNSVELVQAFLATVRLGAVVCPFPVQYREHELSHLGGVADLKAFVTTGDARDRVENAGLHVPILDPLPSGGAGRCSVTAATARTALDVEVDPNECVTICWTSGTESSPKGVPRCHYDWLAMSWGVVDGMGLTADDVMLNPFPMVNMAGIGGMLLPWLRTGCTMAVHHPFDLPTFLTQVATERVSYTVAPPAVLAMLLQREELLAAADISSLRAIGSGSAPLSPAMVKGWQERHGIPIVNFFASNEGVALISDPTNFPDAEARARYFPRWGADGITWASRLGNWTSVRLVDLVTGEQIEEPGRPGELCTKGPTVFAGYLRGTGAVDPFDADGYLHTGDVFELAGLHLEHLRYVDRVKDLVIRGGMNIAPAEIEALLAAHPKIADVAVVGYPDDVLGERVCAVVVAAPGEVVALDDVTAFLRDRRIASFKLPERVEVVDALPRNPVGKVLKRELRYQIATTAGVGS